MTRGGKRAAREEKMRAALEKWERSGLALSQFAEREGIGRKTLYRWRRRWGWAGISSAVVGDQVGRPAESEPRRSRRRSSPR